MPSNESYPHVGDNSPPDVQQKLAELRANKTTEGELLRVIIFNAPLDVLYDATETVEQVELLDKLLREVLNER